MDVETAKRKLREALPDLRERFRVRSIGVFGSYVRGEQKEGSDLDVLVEFEDDAKLSLLDVVGLEIELGELLGAKVDLVEKRDLKPYIAEHILNEVIYV